MFGYLDETNCLNTQGIGLGLYITRMIVQTFGGEVYVKSKIGEGSRFGLTFELSGEQINSGSNIRELNP